MIDLLEEKTSLHVTEKEATDRANEHVLEAEKKAVIGAGNEKSVVIGVGAIVIETAAAIVPERGIEKETVTGTAIAGNDIDTCRNIVTILQKSHQ